MSQVAVFLDETPGEVRGIVARGGRFERLLLDREGDIAQHRMGARCLGRVAAVEPAFGAAFVDLGAEPPFGFLPLGQGPSVREGDRIVAEVTAEPRESKGPTLRLIGPGEGPPRLLSPGPDVPAQLKALAPGVAPVTGVAAIQASWDAEEEAMGAGAFFAETATDLAVERTRALVAVDIDYAHLPGRDAKRGRERANQEGLIQAARLIRLKRWGGLVAIDFAGARLNADALTAAARAAFNEPETVFGPLNRFGVLQLSLPWRLTPIEEVLNGWGSRTRTARSRAIGLVRRLRHAMLSDARVARFTLRAAPDEAALAAGLVARLGPRAAVVADPDLKPGESAWIDET